MTSYVDTTAKEMQDLRNLERAARALPHSEYAAARLTQNIMETIPSGILRILKKYPGTYLAGGALRSYFDLHPTSDYDIFFESLQLMNEVIGDLVSATDRPNIVRGHTTTILIGTHKVQFVVPSESKDDEISPQELIDRFDIRACQMAFFYHKPKHEDVPEQFRKHFEVKEKGSFKFITSDDAIEDASKGRITFHNFEANIINNPLIRSTKQFQLRVNKFLDRGYTLDSGREVYAFIINGLNQRFGTFDTMNSVQEAETVKQKQIALTVDELLQRMDKALYPSSGTGLPTNKSSKIPYEEVFGFSPIKDAWEDVSAQDMQKEQSPVDDAKLEPRTLFDQILRGLKKNET